MNSLHTFAEAASGGGLSALGLNLQSFVFQLITFVIVLAILRKFVYGRLVATLEARRAAVIESLDNAKDAAEAMRKANIETARLIAEARAEAEGIIALAHKESSVMLEAAETKAQQRAEHIVDAAEKRLAQDVEAARETLKKETLSLVALATEKVLGSAVTERIDAALIERSLKEAGGK